MVLHSTRLNAVGEIITECAIPIVDTNQEDMQMIDYQLGTINLGRPGINQQMNLIDIVASSTKSWIIKNKQKKDELKDQLDQLHMFLKEVSTLISQHAVAPESPILLTKKEVDDFVQMKRKLGMLEKWLDKLNEEVDNFLADGFKIHKEALELAGDLDQHIKDLDKQDNEYKKYVKRFEDINKVPKLTLFENSILEEDSVYFVEKTMSIVRYKSKAIHVHEDEVQEISKDLSQ